MFGLDDEDHCDSLLDMVDRYRDKIRKLKDIGTAYRLACEWNHCPEFSDLTDEAKEESGLTDNILKRVCEHSGNRPDEIVNILIEECFKPVPHT